MMDNHDEIINAALNTYPLAPLPQGFVKQTMARVNPKPRFQIDFLGLALPVFFVFYFITILIVVLIMAQFLNPVLSLQLESYFRLLLLYASNASPALLTFIVTASMVCLATGTAGLLLWLDELKRPDALRQIRL